MRSAILALATALVLGPLPSSAETPLDDHSATMTHLANIGYETGSDIAFFDHYAVAGDLGSEGEAGFRIIDIADPENPKVVSLFQCYGSQNDVSVYGRLVFMSVDGRRAGEGCDAASGGAMEGLRIVDISDLTKPRQIKFVQTECGSHTHTINPDPEHGRLLIYILSYPSSTSTDPECNPDRHRKISVVEVPLGNPTAADVIATPSVAPALGCHDVTLFLERKIAAAACISESQMWDISDPVHPKVIAHIESTTSRPIDVHHGTAFSWDGKIMALGDEAGGYTGPACISGEDPLGAIWFFDVTDPANPVEQGFYSLPRPRVLACTAHNFNVVPLLGRNILVGGFYTGGVTVVDFTDPSAAHEIAHYWNFGPALRNDVAPVGSEVWSAYWYNGYIYSNDMSRGFDVFRLDDPAVAGAVKFSHLNAQVQEPLSKPKPVPVTKEKPAVLGAKRGKPLPATGVGAAWPGAGALLAAAAGTAAWLRRRA
jgi:hypothetical protein